jgi:two-component system OmpR family response regulator
VTPRDEATFGRTKGEAARLLLLGQEPGILVFVSRVLRAQGFDVERAADVAQGITLACAGGHDLVLLDLVMGGSGDAATLRAVAAAEPERPVVVLSAVTAVEFKVRCLDLGAADYITRPFALAELIARVRARLRHAPAPAPSTGERFIQVGRITLDLDRHAADAGAGQVALSHREFELLLHLMRRAGTPCTREQLLAEIWDTEFDPGTNVVDVYIRRLRRKLGGDAIETRRKIGYALRSA